MDSLIEKMETQHNASDEELMRLIGSKEEIPGLSEAAGRVRDKSFGRRVYIRGLIEISNYCKNNCYYCGIRAGNPNAVRYRLTKDEILDCCRTGYALGFRTFVLQGGEDAFFTDDVLCGILSGIKKEFPDCAITLSLGERSYESYLTLRQAGADRYLLRHETADPAHYERLHPASMRLSDRKECLYHLKKAGYQVGSGFMVGSPFQTAENLVQDIRFLQELQPDMIGIGPFISHKDTPFCSYPNGTLSMTLRLIAILRLLFPEALLPATTALGTIHPKGRQMGMDAGANVVMPNLSPKRVRALYNLYDHKANTGAESAEGLQLLKDSMEKAGYQIVVDRGDSPAFSKK